MENEQKTETEIFEKIKCDIAEIIKEEDGDFATIVDLIEDYFELY